jgi:hypothetical protein
MAGGSLLEKPFQIKRNKRPVKGRWPCQDKVVDDAIGKLWLDPSSSQNLPFFKIDICHF